MSRHTRVVLSAGEEAVLDGDFVTAELLDGLVEVGGYPLPAATPIVLGKHSTLYTLDGGSFAVSSKGALNVQKQPAGAAAVYTLVKSRIYNYATSNKNGCVVLVLGDDSAGKAQVCTCAANYLIRTSVDNSYDASLAQCRVFFADGDVSANMVTAPGCIAVVEVGQEGIAPGSTFLDSTPVAFFTGAPEVTTPEQSTTYLYWLSQLMACTRSLVSAHEGVVPCSIVNTPQAPAQGDWPSGNKPSSWCSQRTFSRLVHVSCTKVSKRRFSVPGPQRTSLSLRR